ncbi:MAG: hypothetical protein P1P81_05225, partial [Desulfobulbales bacterium]|nr:hypothetical protein [Desulfobulbales bacterium]
MVVFTSNIDSNPWWLEFTRRPAGRPITAHLRRWQLVDIPKYYQHRCRLASAPFSNAHGFRKKSKSTRIQVLMKYPLIR